MPLDRHDALSLDAWLDLHERFATWDKAPWSPTADHAVSSPPPATVTMPTRAPCGAL